MQALHEQFAGRDDFALLSVSGDYPDSMDELRPMIEEYGITYPVLHGLDGDEPDLHDWDILGFPSAFLINPQGVVLLETHIGEYTAGWLETLLNLEQEIPVTQLSVDNELLDNGGLRFTVRSDRQLDVHVNVGKILEEYWEDVDGEWQEVENPPADAEPNMSAYHSLDDWENRIVSLEPLDGSFVYSFEIEPVTDDNLWLIQCSVSAQIPGTEELEAMLPMLMAGSEWFKPESDS